MDRQSRALDLAESLRTQGLSWSRAAEAFNAAGVRPLGPSSRWLGPKCVRALPESPARRFRHTSALLLTVALRRTAGVSASGVLTANYRRIGPTTRPINAPRDAEIVFALKPASDAPKSTTRGFLRALAVAFTVTRAPLRKGVFPTRSTTGGSKLPAGPPTPRP